MTRNEQLAFVRSHPSDSLGEFWTRSWYMQNGRGQARCCRPRASGARNFGFARGGRLRDATDHYRAGDKRIDHFLDQVLDFCRHRRSTMTNPAFPFPIQPKALAVPSDDGLGFHNAQGGAPIGPNSGEPDPNESVARSQSQGDGFGARAAAQEADDGVPGSPRAERPEFEGSGEGKKRGSEEYEHSPAPYQASPQVQRFQ